MKTITNKFKLALAVLGLFAIGTVSAQTTSGNIAKQTESTPGSDGTGSIRLIDNKGTIKYLQASNGVTMLTNDNTGDVTTTTWQLGGTLTTDTYIDVDGNAFALDGLELVTDITTASTDADADLNESDHGGTTTGFTVLIRDEATGKTQKIRASDLLQVQAFQVILEGGTLPTVGVAEAIANLPAEYAKISVYRNGAKLIGSRDYTATAGNLTLVDRSSAALAPQDWTLYSTDIIEIQWVR